MKQLLDDIEDALDSEETLKEYINRRGDCGEQYAIKHTYKLCKELIDIIDTMDRDGSEL
jgi:hypothetical protein